METMQTIKTQTPITYLDYIDGLRAIAVLAVIFYHAGLSFSGGYIGVDVFFVVSGYLITLLIFRDIKDGTFSITSFWLRRARRILPCLTVVIIAALITGYFIFLQKDFQKLGGAACAQTLFVSNFFFYLTSTYFEKASEIKPLLHTWSLSVEEQFYLLFPISLLFVYRHSKQYVTFFILFLGGLSMILSAYASSFNPSLNFYLLPTRAWELLLGSCVAIFSNRIKLTFWLSELLSIAGVFAIIVPAFAYNSSTRMAPLIPCVGTALIIMANQGALTYSASILSLRPLTFIGLVSYSAYLWHWPILVFMKYWNFKLNNAATISAVLFSTFLLAVISWKYIEIPFRKRFFFKNDTHFITFFLFSTLTVFAAGIAIYYGYIAAITNSIVNKTTDKSNSENMSLTGPSAAWRYLDGEKDLSFRNEMTLNQVLNGRFVELGSADLNAPIQLLVAGDSHAMAILAIIDILCKESNVRGIAATHSSTVPLLGYISYGDSSCLNEDSGAFQDVIYNYVRSNHIPYVIFAAHWTDYAERGQTSKIREGVLKTVEAYKKIGVRIYFMKPVPQPPWNVPRFLFDAALQGLDPEKFSFAVNEKHNKDQSLMGIMFNGVATQGVEILDPAPCFLNSNHRFRVARNGKAFYWDHSHLSTAGAMELRPLFEPIILGIGKPITSKKPNYYPP